MNAYNKALAEHVEASTVEVVNGHAIRPVRSMRFGLVYTVEGTNKGHSTLDGARKIARNALVLLLAVLCLAGCATQNKATWQKPGASAAQREQDAKECKYEADKALASAPRCALCEIGSNDLIVDAVAGSPVKQACRPVHGTAGLHVMNKLAVLSSAVRP